MFLGEILEGLRGGGLRGHIERHGFLELPSGRTSSSINNSDILSSHTSVMPSCLITSLADRSIRDISSNSHFDFVDNCILNSSVSLGDMASHTNVMPYSAPFSPTIRSIDPHTTTTFCPTAPSPEKDACGLEWPEITPHC